MGIVARTRRIKILCLGVEFLDFNCCVWLILLLLFDRYTWCGSRCQKEKVKCVIITKYKADNITVVPQSRSNIPGISATSCLTFRRLRLSYQVDCGVWGVIEIKRRTCRTECLMKCLVKTAGTLPSIISGCLVPVFRKLMVATTVNPRVLSMMLR